eukprot:5540819-Karenia_brevis.AAC.1
MKGLGRGRRGKSQKGTSPTRTGNHDRVETPPLGNEILDGLLTAPRYHGTDELFTICTAPFEREEWVARRICNRLDHERCMMAMATTADTLQCPNCRGPPTVKATFHFFGNYEDRSSWRRQPDDDFHDARESSEGLVERQSRNRGNRQEIHQGQ